MKTILLLFVSIIVFTNTLLSQKLESVISKTEMYEDFDSLLSIVSNANPHLEIYKKTIGIDVINEMRKRRVYIDTISSLTSYYIHVALTLRLIPENHTRLLKGRDVERVGSWYKEHYPNYFESSTFNNYKKIDEGFMAYYGKVEGNFRKIIRSYDIPLSYINGDFYALRPISIISKKTKDTIITINSGDKLLKINGYSVDSFIRCHYDEYTYAFHINKWDNNNKLFYNEQPLKNSYLYGKDVYLEFYDNKTGRKKNVHYIGKDIQRFFKSDNYLGSTNKYKHIKDKVLYFDKILYIKITKMDFDKLSYFKNEILKYKDSAINRVVIDVRDNGGGSDFLWEGILSAISYKTLCRHQRLGIRNWKYLNSFVNSKFDSLAIYHDSILNQDFRLLTDDDECSKIIPDSNSINYSGKIYLLHNGNSFSSATAFVTFALGSNKIVAVGESNGYLGGYGISPFLFQLPYSKIMFVMHSTVHIPVRATNANDYYWNKTELKVSTTPYFESLMYAYSNFDIFTEDFLKNKDLYFKKVLEIKD